MRGAPTKSHIFNSDPATTRSDYEPTRHPTAFESPSPEPLACDFDQNARCDIGDLDELLYTGIGSGDLKYDLDESGAVDLGDRDVFLSRELATVAGDFDLDGKVSAADLNILGANRQKDTLRSYAQGDANGDGVANATDLNTVGSHWQVGSGAPLAAMTVPEPDCHGLVLVSLVALLVARKKDDV